MFALRRIVFRALLVGIGELLLLELVPTNAAVVNVTGDLSLLGAFLAIPAACATGVEIAASGRSHSSIVSGAFVAALAGVVLAYLHALYTGGVLESNELRGGLFRLDAQLHLLEAAPDVRAPLVLFFAGLALPFALATFFALRRPRRRARLLATAAAAIFGMLTQESSRMLWGARTFEQAVVVATLSVPLLCALADSLTTRAQPAAEVDAQNAT